MFIAVDLKVIEGLADATARAAGVDGDRILAGLVRLWHRCWADEVDHLGRMELAGAFGMAGLEHILAALVEFGFLAACESGIWRVKGVAKYLRLRESRRRGGKKSAANLRRGKSQDQIPGSGPALEPEASRNSGPALSPNTEHRTPRVKKQKPADSTKKPVDPRHAPLVKALKDHAPGNCFLGKTSGRDAAAVTDLLAMAEPLEVLERWRRALGRAGFPIVRTLPELVRNWPHFATDSPTTGAAWASPTATDWSNQSKPFLEGLAGDDP